MQWYVFGSYIPLLLNCIATILQFPMVRSVKMVMFSSLIVQLLLVKNKFKYIILMAHGILCVPMDLATERLAFCVTSKDIMAVSS